MMNLLTIIGKGIAYLLGFICFVYLAFYGLIYMVTIIAALFYQIG